MFERFTQEARQVVVLAQEEARALKHSYIGTEHILLGLLREEEEHGATGPLQALGVTLDAARERVSRIVGIGDEESGGQIPFTPRAKKVLELSLREALALGHDWIGPEHILLGVARENEGVASHVLLDFDAESLRVRNQVIRALAEAPRPRTAPRASRGPELRHDPADVWYEGIGAILLPLASDIRRQLGRDPDLGDLLLTIACLDTTLSGEALRELGVDLDVLWGTLERLRERRNEHRSELEGKLDQAKRAKHEALESGEFEKAARQRDEERELHDQLGSPMFDRALLNEVRRRLGLSAR